MVELYKNYRNKRDEWCIPIIIKGEFMHYITRTMGFYTMGHGMIDIVDSILIPSDDEVGRDNKALFDYIFGNLRRSMDRQGLI